MTAAASCPAEEKFVNKEESMSRLVQPPELMTEVSLSPESFLSAAKLFEGQTTVGLKGPLAVAEPTAEKSGAAEAPRDAQVEAKQKGDNYLSRVAKYIPAEILAAYITALGLIKTSDEPNLRWWLYLVFFVLCLVMTPVYFNLLAEKGEPKKLQMVISSVAFLVWAYSLGGFFDEIKLYHSLVASLILIAFTLISGAFFPRPVAAGK
ncbi:MAG: hypothetical protein KKH66_01380, partial [Proteobacteria bacterium]|nr:hypothetical protein [Pseudomonadota bacterium]